MKNTFHDDFLSTRYCGFRWGESPSRESLFDLAKGGLMGRKEITLTLGTKRDGSPIETKSLLLAIELSNGSEKNPQAPLAMGYVQSRITRTDSDMICRPIQPICAFPGRYRTGQLVGDMTSLFCFKYAIDERKDVELAIRKVDETYRVHHIGAQARCVPAHG